MELMTRETMAAGAAEDYEQWAELGPAYGTKYDAQHIRLTLLGNSPAPDAVDAITGGRTNTPACLECGNNDNGPRVRLESWPDRNGEPTVAPYCETCLRLAVALLPQPEARSTSAPPEAAD